MKIIKINNGFLLVSKGTAILGYYKKHKEQISFLKRFGFLKIKKTINWFVSDVTISKLNIRSLVKK